MYDLQEEQRRLKEVLQRNFRGDVKSAFQVYYFWWRLYALMNKNLEETTSEEGKRAIIDDFKEFAEEMQKDSEDMMQVIQSKGEVTSEEIKNTTVSLPPHIEKMKEIMTLEMDKFKEILKSLKKEEKTKGGKKVSGALKRLRRSRSKDLNA